MYSNKFNLNTRYTFFKWKKSEYPKIQKWLIIMGRLYQVEMNVLELVRIMCDFLSFLIFFPKMLMY